MDLYPDCFDIVPTGAGPECTPIHQLLPFAYHYPGAAAERIVRKTATTRHRDPVGTGPALFIFEDDDGLEARLLATPPRSRPLDSGQYCCGMPELIKPTGRLHAAWVEAHAEWGPGVHEDGFGLLPTDDVDSPAGFAAWVDRLAGERERCTYRWIVEGGQVLGGIALRHEGHDLAPRAGHIGYGIRPSVRRRGLATWALGCMVREAQGLGMERLLIVCEIGNAPSARTIERQGGILEDDAGNGAVLRYWIRTGESGA